MKKNYKKLAMLMAIMILVLSLGSTGFAANTIATLKATYRNITVFKNGTQVNFSKEPFIVDGTTYVPLRDMSEILDKDVTWDNTTSQIGINDKPGQSANEMYAQLVGLQQQIVQLQNENKSLKDQLSGTSVDLDDLEDDLNDDFDEIGDLPINEIVLKGDKDDIKVEIYFSTKKDADYDAWEDLDDDDKEDFLQDIVDDILKVYKNADITGFMKDEYENKKVVNFSITSKGVVKLGSSSSSTGDLGDLEDDLNDGYTKIKGIKIEEIILNGDEDDIEVQIYVDLTDEDDYDDWVDIDKDDKIDFLQDIVDDILDEFEDASISGYFEDDYDNSKLLKFTVNSSGTVKLN